MILTPRVAISVVSSVAPTLSTADQQRAVFTRHGAEGTLRVILTLHVDDGLLLRKRADPIYQKIKKLNTERFDIKSWLCLDDGKGVGFRGLLLDHVSPQFAHSVSKTARELEYAWSATLVSKVHM